MSGRSERFRVRKLVYASMSDGTALITMDYDKPEGFPDEKPGRLSGLSIYYMTSKATEVKIKNEHKNGE